MIRTIVFATLSLCVSGYAVWAAYDAYQAVSAYEESIKVRQIESRKRDEAFWETICTNPNFVGVEETTPCMRHVAKKAART